MCSRALKTRVTLRYFLTGLTTFSTRVQVADTAYYFCSVHTSFTTHFRRLGGGRLFDIGSGRSKATSAMYLAFNQVLDEIKPTDFLTSDFLIDKP